MTLHFVLRIHRQAVDMFKVAKKSWKLDINASQGAQLLLSVVKSLGGNYVAHSKLSLNLFVRVAQES